MKKIEKSAAMKLLERVAGGPLTFGRMLRSIRLGEEETLESFASGLGISRANLCDIEHGRRGVSVQRAAQWAEQLGYHPMRFVELALQEQVDSAGLKFQVGVRAARRSKSAA